MEWEHEHGDQCIGCTYIFQSHYFLPIPDLCPACECKAYWDVVWRDVVKFMWRGSVERINALAEKHATVNKDNMPLWMTFMHYGKKFSYIHAADIVMEELDK